MTQKKAIWLTLGAVILCAYLGLWIYSTVWFKEEINRAYALSEKDGVRFLGPKPTLGNFPFVPEVYYTGGVQTGNAIILFHEMTLRGYPIPGTKLAISFPSGLSLDGIADPKIWTLDRLAANIIIPFSLPRTFEYEDLARWREAGGKIDVRHYDMVKEELTAEGDGLLTLDEGMQPVFTLNSTMRNHDAFIQAQVQKGLIEPFAGAIGMTILNGLSKTEEKTGEKIVSLNVRVKDRTLHVGSLQVLTLPEIVWDKRTSLVQPR